jgi:pyroglutamyl-peptidase
MKALVTGFEPFGGDGVNPSQEALRRLPSRLGTLDIITRALPVVFGEALPILRETIAATTPDIVLSVGLAGGRAELSLERVAINMDDARIPDNAGNRPIDRPVVACGPAAYFATCRSRPRSLHYAKRAFPPRSPTAPAPSSATMSFTG